jgi:hypothetical protein
VLLLLLLKLLLLLLLVWVCHTHLPAAMSHQAP